MIDETRRRRIDEVCDGALARNGDERAAFIAAACGDDAALRKHVEELLAHAQTAEKFLAMPAAAVAADVLAENSGVSMIGRQLASYDCAPDRGLARRRNTKKGRGQRRHSHSRSCERRTRISTGNSRRTVNGWPINQTNRDATK